MMIRIPQINITLVALKEQVKDPLFVDKVLLPKNGLVNGMVMHIEKETSLICINPITMAVFKEMNGEMYFLHRLCDSISHETLHAVLHHTEGKETSRKLDVFKRDGSPEENTGLGRIMDENEMKRLASTKKAREFVEEVRKRTIAYIRGA